MCFAIASLFNSLFNYDCDYFKGSYTKSLAVSRLKRADIIGWFFFMGSYRTFPFLGKVVVAGELNFHIQDPAKLGNSLQCWFTVCERGHHFKHIVLARRADGHKCNRWRGCVNGVGYAVPYSWVIHFAYTVTTLVDSREEPIAVCCP